MWNIETFEKQFCFDNDKIYGSIIGLIYNESSYLKAQNSNDYGKNVCMNQLNSMIFVIRNSSNEIQIIKMTEDGIIKQGNKFLNDYECLSGNYKIEHIIVNGNLFLIYTGANNHCLHVLRVR